MDGEDDAWFDRELAGCSFVDERLNKRLRKLVAQIGSAMGQSIPLVCQDWANTKAAYRFFSNDRVSEADILAGHFQSTFERAVATDGPVFVLHDTTEFSFQREDTEAIGITKSINSGRDKAGRLRSHTICGILMHSSSAVMSQGLPLGLAAIKFWTRKKFKGTAALKKKINPTRVPIEKKESIRWLENVQQSTALLADPGRCVHIGDRESDIYELFCAAREAGTHFLIRTCVDRLAGDGDHLIADELHEVVVKGLHRINVRDGNGEPDEAVLEIRYRKICVTPPIGKQKHYPALTLTIIRAEERGTPKNRKKVEWKLITDLPVVSRADAIEKLRWYALRWKIEVFHKILKSGCKAEELKLRTAQRLTNLVAVFCILSWRVFWMTMLNRATPEAPPNLALTPTEIAVLDRLVHDRPKARRRTLSHYLTKIARLGGYLARASDPPPGNSVMWRGLSRLTDIALGATVGAEIVGNSKVSLDPYMRGRMSDAPSYAKPVGIGEVMEGGTVSDVVTSNLSGFAKGDIVVGRTGWQTHALSDGSGLQKVDPTRAPISAALSVLGMPGMTAYVGLFEIGKPAAGETVVVAAASGAVGSVVGQIARIKGARAVGIAGGTEKCRYVTKELGFDDCVDHRTPDFAARLAAACPKGVDVYFENVGGAVFEAVFPMLNPFARIPVCGLISMYNATTLSPSLMSGRGQLSGRLTHMPF